MIIGVDVMNNRGQTLVEFVIILPVFLLILFYVIDFGRIIYSKNKLENSLNDVVFMIENDKDSLEIKNFLDSGVSLNVKDEGKYKNIILTQKIELIAPLITIVLDNPYEISVSRVVYNEETGE